MTERSLNRAQLLFALTASMGFFATLMPAQAFCVRNDTGAPIKIEAIEESAHFNRELANNKRVCCKPKDEACAIGGAKVKLSISGQGSAATCQVAVTAKGNVNVTGKPDKIKCKANKAGSTMDWASG